MRRREFITALGGAIAAWPLAARAQQPMPVVGYLSGQSVGDRSYQVDAFRQGLSETGYIEGRDVAIEYRWGDGHYERLPALAADLVFRRVTVIAAAGTPSVLSAKAATTTIPIAFYSASDPVEAGLVASLNQPGGNLTGVTSLNVELGPKRLELLHELVPAAASMAVLVNPTSPTAKTQWRDLQAAARTLGLGIHVLNASADRDFDSVFAALTQLRASGLVICVDGFFTSRSKKLAALLLRQGLPAIYNREFAAAGGLLSYGGNIKDAHRQLGVYTGRILKGEKPADLPILQATKVELIINLKTAKALGLTVPLSLLGRADEVVE